MESLPLTRAYLESLTTSDLFGIADGSGVDISNNPDRVFVIEELLDLTSKDDSRPSVLHEAEMTDSALNESVPLPKQYNINFIKVMIRDPLWAFVFWEIKISDKEQFEKADDFDGYYLKVSRLEEFADASQSRNSSLFKVPVKPDDTAWYLSLSPALEDESTWADISQFKVEFCASLGGAETVLAVSDPVKLPCLLELPSSCGSGKSNGAMPANGSLGSGGAGQNQLIRLSGYGDFHVLRKSERNVRIKRGEGVCKDETING